MNDKTTLEDLFQSVKTKYKEDIICLLEQKTLSSIDDIINYLEDRIYDDIHDIIEGHIDIYYYDLRQWFVENCEYVERAIEEFGASDDIYCNIANGQYLYYEDAIGASIETMLQHLKDLEKTRRDKK